MEDRVKMNRRGIVLREEGEGGEIGGEIPARVGSCWRKGKKVNKIVGFNDRGVEVIKWEGKKIEVGKRVKLSRTNNYEGYTTLMGSRETMQLDEIGIEGMMVELGRDSVSGKEVY